ncbi:MAG: amidohydrolase family protein [Actinomycetota bacterium]|nr:amidohydrolase family protein [Actinomycetota bacterium]
MAVDAVSVFDGIPVVDADTHLTEPHDLWTSRAPADWVDRVPTVRQVDGQPMWTVDGQVLGKAVGAAVVLPNGTKSVGTEFMGLGIDDVHAGASSVEARLALMDQLGIHAQIVYPNIVGFGGQRFAAIADPALKQMCATIFNDAMTEIQAESGNRMFPMALLPWWDIDAAVAEVERVHALGLRGINTNSDPQNDGFPDLADAHWDPVWQVCADLEMPVNFHIGASATSMSWLGSMPWPSLDDERKLALGSLMVMISNFRTIGNLLLSGVLERHPDLQVVSVESGLGWIPFLLEGLDYEVGECAPHIADHLSLKPSQYFRRQVHACFWFEREHLSGALDALGPDHLMFETDFPHPTCLYPDPMARTAESLAGLDAPIQRKLLSTNAADLYKLPLPATRRASR